MTTVWRAERGKISPSTARAYDRYFSQRGDVEKGAIIAGRDRLEEAHKRAVEVVRAGVLRQEGVSPSDRRDLLRAVGVPAVATALDQVEEAYQALTAGQPNPWTLGELADDAVTIAARYWSTPLDELLSEVLDRWRQCYAMLKRAPLGAPAQQLLQLAGTYAYYVARIGSHTGNRRLASKFGRLAARYAEISGDPLLIGSVAGLRSCEAFDVAEFAEAADIAGEAARVAHPHCKARLHAYLALALAADGHADKARDALTAMREHMVNLPPMPGPGEFGEGEYLGHSGMVLVKLEDDRDAEAFARERIAGTPTDNYVAHGMAWATIGESHASRAPGAAADAGLRALGANRAWPSIDVEYRARQLYCTLARDHGKVAEVVRLGEAVAALCPVAV